MRKQEKSDILDNVRTNLRRIRKELDKTQEEFAGALNLQRTAYTKKEKGQSTISLSDIGALAEAFGVGVGQFFQGYRGFIYEVSGEGISESARKKFPYLEQLVLAANQAATGNEIDHGFFVQCMTYALQKVERKDDKS